MVRKLLIVGLVMSGGAAFAQGPVAVTNMPWTGPDAYFPNRFAYEVGDPKSVNEARLDRLKQIFAANPEAVDRLAGMTRKNERVAYIRELDRATPRNDALTR